MIIKRCRTWSTYRWTGKTHVKPNSYRLFNTRLRIHVYIPTRVAETRLKTANNVRDASDSPTISYVFKAAFLRCTQAMEANGGAGPQILHSHEQHHTVTHIPTAASAIAEGSVDLVTSAVCSYFHSLQAVLLKCQSGCH